MGESTGSLNRLLDLLGSPLPLLVICVCVAGFALLLTSERHRWVAVGMLLFVAIPAPFVDVTGTWIEPPFPLNQLSRQGRSVTAVLMALSMIVLVVKAAPEQGVRVSRLLWWFLAMQMLLCVRHLLSPGRLEASGRLVVYAMIFAGFGYALSALWRRSDQMAEPLKAIGLAAFLYASVTAFEMIFFWDRGMYQGRWFGITGNPNHAGMVGAILLPGLLGLATFTGIAKKWRLVVVFVISVLVVQTMLTGSRGAVLASLIGVVMFFRVRLGRLVLLAVPIAAISLVLLSSWGDGGQDLNRLTSTQNTRTGLVTRAIASIGDNFAVGSVENGFTFVENGYLAFVMHTGALGILVLVGLVAAGVSLVVAGVRARARLGAYAPLADAATAGVTALAANNVIEATLLSNLSQTIFIVYLYVICLQLCVNTAREQPDPGAAPVALDTGFYRRSAGAV